MAQLKTRCVDGTPTSEVTPVTIWYIQPGTFHHGHFLICFPWKVGLGYLLKWKSKATVMAVKKNSNDRSILKSLEVYATLGCNIQGLRTMGLSVQYWPRWFQDFPTIWLAILFGANKAHLRICTLPEKNIFLSVKWVVSGWNNVFPKENSSCEVFMVTLCPYAGINKWMEKSNNFAVRNGKTSNSESLMYGLIRW